MDPSGFVALPDGPRISPIEKDRTMDHNELLGAHQVALMKADAAPDDDLRLQHLEDAAVISGIVSRLNAARGGGDFSSPPPTQTPLDRAAKVARLPVPDADGGACPPYNIENKVPPIQVRTVVEFSVGPYRYSSITDALAQQARIARRISARGEI